MQPEPGSPPSHRRETQHFVNFQAQADRAKGPLALAAASVVGGFLLSTPLAFEHAVEDAQVVDAIADVPCTFEYNHSGGSQLDLGIAGRIYDKAAEQHGIGLSVEAKDTPFSGQGSVTSLFSSNYLNQLAGLYHNPKMAIKGPVSALADDRDRRWLDYELKYGGLASVGLLGAALLFRHERRDMSKGRARAVAIGGLVLAIAAPNAYAFNRFEQWQGDNPPISDIRLPLEKLADSQLRNLTVSNQDLQFLINDSADGVRKVLARQAEHKQAFLNRASVELAAQARKIHAPSSDEIAVLVGADMHDNEAMTEIAKQTVGLFTNNFGKNSLSLMVSAGDMTYGSALEKSYVDAQAQITKTVVVGPGNHDTTVTEQQMDAAGIVRLKGAAVKVEGVTITGGQDPLETLTPFGNSTQIRDSRDESDDVEAAQGQALYEKNSLTPPDITVMHEGYSAGPYIGLSDVTKSSMEEWFKQRGNNTLPWEDGVQDLHTSLLMYGHWHRAETPRVVWNSDGSWTLVMELNTMGGAIADPTPTHFSTPNDAPGQPASYAVVYVNKNTGLVSGYQQYDFTTAGEATIGDFVPVGLQLTTDKSEQKAQARADARGHQ